MFVGCSDKFVQQVRTRPGTWYVGLSTDCWVVGLGLRLVCCIVGSLGVLSIALFVRLLVDCLRDCLSVKVVSRVVCLLAAVAWQVAWQVGRLVD